MHESWRYVLPCGHHSIRYYPDNPPERRYMCIACTRTSPDAVHYHADEVVDKKKTDDYPRVTNPAYNGK